MSSAEKMVERIRTVYGLTSCSILKAMLTVPRHLFVDKKYQGCAYADQPLPIGYKQTISQPYTVAFMTELVMRATKKNKRKRSGKILEIGTGSGYQAAILSKFFKSVYSVEIVAGLVRKAKTNLKKAGIDNVYVIKADGSSGWKEKAPFDAITITANIRGKMPKRLFEQLKDGGVLVAPVNGIMKRYIKNNKSEIVAESFGRFDFVPFKFNK